MRIAMVSEHASPLAVLGGVDAGGQNVHVAALARALARCGAQVDVYTRRDDPALPAQVPFGAGVFVHHVEAGAPEPIAKDELLPHMGALAAGLVRAWRRRRPDLVHAHFWMSGLAAVEAGEALGLPVVQTFHALGVVKRRHQGAADTSPPERIALERELLARTAGVVATCRDERDELRALGADPRRVRIVPCGVDLERFRPDGPAWPRRARRARIVALGRLVERKGVAELIEALAARDGAELLVAGGLAREQLDADAEACRLRAVARRCGVEGRVTLLGRVERDEVPGLLRSADLVACCPWYEPFGIVPVEAMACGVPVLGSAVGGLLDTVVDEVTGLLVPPRSVDRIADALARLLGDGAWRARLGAAGAARARRHYGWDRVAAATLAAYRDLALHPRAAHPARARPRRAADAVARTNVAGGRA
jgi:glycosyltransferase involved in cell wall biosynthesis